MLDQKKKPKRGRKPSSSVQRDLARVSFPGGYSPYVTRGDCVFDDAAARRVLRFFSGCLTHVKGHAAGKPLLLEPWWEDVIATLFGWKRPDGTRRYRNAYVTVARKNSKSTTCAGIALAMLAIDGEQGAEVYSAGGDREQASIVFDIAGGMVANNDIMRQEIRVLPSTKRAVHYKSHSFYKALSAEAYTKHGLNPHGIIFDELHVQRDRNLWDVLQTALGARRQPLTVAITTAGHDKHSICYEQYKHACHVRDGTIEDRAFLPVIYELAESDDWQDESLWVKANPNLGHSLTLDFLRENAAVARQSAAAENTFRRLHLNQWTEQDVRFFPMDAWRKCERMDWPTDAQWFAGLDLANTQDITALVLVARKDGRYFVRPHFWIPADGARLKEQRDRVPYSQWQRDGFVTFTPGRTTDQDYVKRKLLEYRDSLGVREVAFDPWNAGKLVQELEKEAMKPFLFAQGGFANWAEPTKLAEKLVLEGRLVHNGNPVLEWMAANTVTISDDVGNHKPAKGRSNEKIDGIVAMLMAMARAMLRPEYKSVYDLREPTLV